MRSTTFIGCVGTIALSFGLVACLSEPGDGGEATGGAGSGGTDGLGGSSGSVATGGTGAPTGGTTGLGGTVGTGGTGGVSTGGTGGVVSTGGTVTGGAAGVGTTGGSGGTFEGGTGGGGGAVSTGGVMTTGGTGGVGMGGAPGGAGGRGGSGGSGNAGGKGGAGAVSGTGGTGPAGCTKGTKGSQVAVIGESFIAASHQITQQIESRAKAAGALAQSERYVDNSVSGTTLANNQIGSQYDRAVTSSGTIKYVLMDGGGNDCLINNNGAAALTAATQLFQRMATKGTEKVVFFFYPDPIGSNFASLKTCLDSLRPQMKAICDGLTSPKCYWIDLRTVWNGHSEYTSDGIHPTSAGSKATGDAVWESMVANCVAQ